MDEELALAVFKRWRDGLPVAETVFYKAASVLYDNPGELLGKARGMTKLSQAVKPVSPPKPEDGKVLKKTPSKPPPAPKPPTPMDQVIGMSPPPQAGPSNTQAPPQEELPQEGAQEAQEEQEGEIPKEEAEVALNQMDALQKVQFAAPHLTPELLERYSIQLAQAEEQMGTPIIDHLILKKYIDEFKRSDQDMQKAFLNNLKQMSKQMYGGQQAAPGAEGGQVPQQ